MGRGSVAFLLHNLRPVKRLAYFLAVFSLSLSVSKTMADEKERIPFHAEVACAAMVGGFSYSDGMNTEIIHDPKDNTTTVRVTVTGDAQTKDFLSWWRHAVVDERAGRGLGPVNPISIFRPLASLVSYLIGGLFTRFALFEHNAPVGARVVAAGVGIGLSIGTYAIGRVLHHSVYSTDYLTSMSELDEFLEHLPYHQGQVLEIEFPPFPLVDLAVDQREKVDGAYRDYLDRGGSPLPRLENPQSKEHPLLPIRKFDYVKITLKVKQANGYQKPPELVLDFEFGGP